MHHEGLQQTCAKFLSTRTQWIKKQTDEELNGDLISFKNAFYVSQAFYNPAKHSWSSLEVCGIWEFQSNKSFLQELTVYYISSEILPVDRFYYFFLQHHLLLQPAWK